MTTITATSILASQHAITGKRIDTMLLRYPRWIHAEPRTHRVMKFAEDMEIEVRTPSLMEDENLSRNASSSRAMPVSKLIKDVMDNPAVPVFWGKNQKGMQADEECDAAVVHDWLPSHVKMTNEQAWLQARNAAVSWAQAFDKAGYHKQIVNRLLEPFSHITVVVTATEWENFFHLRDHADAEPHIAMLARAMKKARDEAVVQVLQPGEWHLPFTDHRIEDLDDPDVLQDFIKLSVARCASTSYKTVDGFDMTLDRAMDLHDKLLASDPLHASPAEHQAQADDMTREDFRLYARLEDVEWRSANRHQWGNLKHFRQYRKMLANEAKW